ncbi:MAG: nucleotidyltransferase domain-containing protein [Alphaproteobacteria bacterium]
MSRAVAVFPEVRRVILFGSRARGDARPRSDIDLAIEAPGASSVRWFEILEAADEAPTLLKVDLLRLDEAPQDLADRIRREGRVIYERH